MDFSIDTIHQVYKKRIEIRVVIRYDYRALVKNLQKGEKAKVSAMCLNNAAQKLGEHLGRSGKETAVLDELKE